jgi:Domain of unknown function (DUF4386)
MTTSVNAASVRTARLAGALYLAVMVFGFFGIAYVPATLEVAGDAAATAERIIASEWLFRSGIVSHLIGQIVFIFLVVTLFRLLETVNERRARLMAILALLGVPMAVLSEVDQLAALSWLESPVNGVFTQAQLQAHAMSLLDQRRQSILVTQVFWGLWLFPLGALVFRSGFLPKVIGVLLIVAGAGYVFDSLAQLLHPGFTVVTSFTFVGEVALMLWLLIKGVSMERSGEAIRQSPNEV